MKHIRVHIDAVDDEGRGRGIFTDSEGHDFDVAARGAFVNDDVLVEVERVFSAHQLLVGKATTFLSRGECHVERICPHEGPCPACPLHGAIHSLGVEIKRGRIERALSDVDMDLVIEDLIPHPKVFGYRQKVKLMAHVAENKLRLGVYVPYSHNFVVAEQCPYVHPAINAAITLLLDRLNSKVSPPELARIKAIILRAAKNGVAAIIVTRQNLSDSFIDALNSIVENNLLLSVTERVQRNETNSILAGEVGRQIGPARVEPLEGGPLVDPDSFCQSDPDQASTMYDLIAAFLTEENKEGLFVDAYAGVGGFSRALQQHGAQNITAVELSESARSALNQLGVNVILAPMTQALSELADRGPFEGIVVDPPKKGLMHDAAAIADLHPKRLALVSCDPDAMAKDLQVFLNQGYVVKKIIPIDFFGGTPAIETVVLMTRAVS